jgi:filamentous hemagglutinin
MPRDTMPILKNARHAIVDERKLTAYLLNPTHPRGRDKARIFKSTLGYDRASCTGLIEQIRHAILRHEAVFLRRDRYGRHYRVDLTLEGPRGTGRVRTGWLYDRGSDVPRLTTAYVLRSTAPGER